MKQIHHIWLSVYSKPEDNEQEIIENMKKFFPFNLEEEKISIKRKSCTGFEEKKIIVLQIHLEKTRHIKKFTENLLSTLDQGQKRLILKQKESRLDLENHFFLRFDKTKLIENSEFFLTDEGNCYHLKFSIAAFPTTRENALEVIEQIFSQQHPES
jgi:RNA binding exosome subunit